MRYLQVDFHGAVDDYSKAIALNPKVAGFFYNRGLVRYRLKEFATAARDLNDALEIDPNHESAKLCLESMRQIPAD
jgi:tetratricopeptide (TPR) repeat protein